MGMPLPMAPPRPMAPPPGMGRPPMGGPPPGYRPGKTTAKGLHTCCCMLAFSWQGR